MIDFFITTKPGREHLTRRSVESFLSTVSEVPYRLTVFVDGRDHGELPFFLSVSDHVIVGRGEGLGPGINRCLAHIDVTNRWYSDKRAGDPSQVFPFVCYCQDDLEYSSGWITTLAKMFLINEGRYKLGFASGLECVEHETTRELGGGMLLKRWIRAANMFARREYWMSMWPIPRFDPETGRIRARPNDGIGSGVDWHFIRNHENSVDRTGRQCLVIPGLVRHIGYRESTWLDRELPESDSDKMRMIDGSWKEDET